VCIGVAQANGWNVTTIRILTVVGFFLTSGLVGVAYLAGWIGIPEELVVMPGSYPPPGSYPQGPYPPNASGGYPPRV